MSDVNVPWFRLNISAIYLRCICGLSDVFCKVSLRHLWFILIFPRYLSAVCGTGEEHGRCEGGAQEAPKHHGRAPAGAGLGALSPRGRRVRWLRRTIGRSVAMPTILPHITGAIVNRTKCCGVKIGKCIEVFACTVGRNNYGPILLHWLCSKFLRTAS